MISLTARFLGHPLAMCLAGGVLFGLLGLVVRRWPIRVLLPAAALLMTAAFLVVCGSYLLSPVWMDHVEAGVACLSCLCARGADIYHPFQSAERYASIYGPNLFLVNGWSAHLLGASTFAIKLPGALFAALSLVLVVATARRAAGWWPACAAAAFYCCVGLLFSTQDLSFCDRCDAPILFWITLATWACFQRGGLWTGVLFGLSLGLAENLRFNTIGFFLPLILLLWRKQGWGAVWAAAGMAVVTASLPFMLFNNISLPGYVAWIRVQAHHQLEARAALQTAEWGLYIVTLPAVAALAWWRANPEEFFSAARRHRWFIATGVLAVVAAVLAGSSEAAGRHHVVPLTPVLALVLAVVFGKILRSGIEARGRVRYLAAVGLGVALATLWIGSRESLAIFRTIRSHEAQAAAAIADLRDIEMRYPNRTVGMGSGDSLRTYETTFYRTELVYAGQPYLLDPWAAMDIAAGGLEISAATRQALRDGRFDVWLIPKGERPFDMPSFYKKSGQQLEIFGVAFRSEFAQDYQLRDHSQFFDLWFYRSAK